jgi:hypothetical protein
MASPKTYKLEGFRITIEDDQVELAYEPDNKLSDNHINFHLSSLSDLSIVIHNAIYDKYSNQRGQYG